MAHVGDGLEVGVEDALEHELHALHALDFAVLRPPECCTWHETSVSNNAATRCHSEVSMIRVTELKFGEAGGLTEAGCQHDVQHDSTRPAGTDAGRHASINKKHMQ